jgi:hypothetical protein
VTPDTLWGVSTPPADRVTTEVVVSDSGHTGPGRRTVLALVWTARDPLAVELVLTAQPDHPALARGRWVVLRDFLRYGLEEATGDGEVRIRPDGVRDRVWFELARPGRAVCVSVPRALAREFLDRTERAVPCGAERSDEAIDMLLGRLLGGEEPPSA